MTNTFVWEVPRFDCLELQPKKHKYCVCVPVINEGEKIRKQLSKMASFSDVVDLIILDGGSTDGSLAEDFLRECHVRALLTKRDKGKLSAQLRMGFSFALQEGYEGVITVDGNNKDNVESIPLFIEQLELGMDFVQGSRYIEGGQEINTPLSRKFAIKCIHAPILSLYRVFVIQTRLTVIEGTQDNCCRTSEHIFIEIYSIPMNY